MDTASLVAIIVGQGVIALAFLVAARAFKESTTVLREVRDSYRQQHKSNMAVLARISEQDVKHFQPQPALFTAEETAA